MSVPAGCVTPGTEQGVCACGDVATRPIPATGHTVVTDPEIPATCTQAGKTAGSHCGVCGEVLKAPQKIPAAGHSYTYTPKDASSHTKTCATCGDTETEAHTFDENGKCTLCGQQFVDTTPDIDISPSLSVSRSGATVTITGQMEKKNITGPVTAAVYVVSSDIHTWEVPDPAVICTDDAFTFTLESTEDLDLGEGPKKIDLELTLEADNRKWKYTLTITLRNVPAS